MTLIKHYQCHAWLLFTYYKYKRLTARQKTILVLLSGAKLRKKIRTTKKNIEKEYLSHYYIVLSINYLREKCVPIYPCGQPETHCICTLQTNENARLFDQWQTDACHMAAYSSFIFLVNFLTTSSSEWSIDSYMSRSQASALKYIWFQYFLLK